MAKEVESGRSDEETHSDRDVDHLEREVIAPSGARLILILKSGKHHYARYTEDGGPRQHITAGGGGAFLHPTHGLPERMEMAGPERPTCYRKATTYPSARASKRLRKRIWLLSPPTTCPSPACSASRRCCWPSCSASTSTTVTSTSASATCAARSGPARQRSSSWP